MLSFWKKKPKKSTIERILERSRDSNEETALEFEGDGLTLDTAFKERVLPPGIPNDYARFLEPLHGKTGVDWSIVETIPIHTGQRHFFIDLVTIRLVNGESKQYYFDKSANTKISYSDQILEHKTHAKL